MILQNLLPKATQCSFSENGSHFIYFSYAASTFSFACVNTAMSASSPSSNAVPSSLGANPTQSNSDLAPKNGFTFVLYALFSILIFLYLGSSGFLTTLPMYALRILRQFPPSPPARYEETLVMYSSIFAGLGAAFLGFLATASSSLFPSPPSPGTSYWMPSGLYPSTPNLLDNLPLFAIRSLLSFSSSARMRCRSLIAASFSFFRCCAMRFRCSLSICSRVLAISCPMNRRCFSRSIFSAFSVCSRSMRFALRRDLISAILACFSSAVRGFFNSVDSSKSE
mmetsp:Transcript_32750/g.55723  ORF Transcript_32750/g.55723 Transcript_32750/m.55723 type:complete len:281 (-) Transcript_32750:130-972(-)